MRDQILTSELSHREPTCIDDAGQEPAQTGRLGCPISLRRAAVLLLLLNTTLFYHGCSNHNTHFSAGPLAPFLEMTMAGDDWWPSQFQGGSWFLLAVNLVWQGLVLFLICRASPRGARIVASRLFLVAMATAVLVMNSILFLPPWLWCNVIWCPTMYVQSAVRWMLLGDLGGGEAANRLDVIIASRLYFVALIVTIYGLIRLTLAFLRRYLLVEPNRWWQFRLGGLMATAVLLGTGIGLVVRLIMHNQ